MTVVAPSLSHVLSPLAAVVAGPMTMFCAMTAMTARTVPHLSASLFRKHVRQQPTVVGVSLRANLCCSKEF